LEKKICFLIGNRAAVRSVMINPARKRIHLAIVAALFFGVVSQGCDADPKDPSAGGPAGVQASVALSFPGDMNVSTVSYEIDSSLGVVVAQGTIDLHDPQASLSAVVSLPPGSGYTVSLSATTQAGADCAGISAPFDVNTGIPAAVSLTLTCGGS
jgi:hypothetical protein